MKTNENDQLTKSFKQAQYSYKSPFKFTSMYQTPCFIDLNNNAESDLTELSWLTNNVQLFNRMNDASFDYLNEKSTSNLYYSDANQMFRKNTQINEHRALNLIKNCAAEKLETNKKFNVNSISKKIPKKLMKLQQSENESNICIKKISYSPLTNKLVGVTNYKSELNIKYDYTKIWGLNKPQLTLSCLIFMAIVDSKEKCLPVRKIYEWIEMNFPFYKYGSNGWKSSIRHNLSFSKCFRKIHSTDDLNKSFTGVDDNNELLKGTQIDLNRLNDISGGNKRRAPNTNGTYWTVCSDSKAYLIQALKKSSFWFHNSQYFSNVNEYVLKNQSPTSSNADFLIKRGRFKKLKPCFNNDTNHKEITFDEDISDNDSDNEEKTDLLRFMEEQQKEMCLNNSSNVFDMNRFDSNDLAAAAVLASSSGKLDLSSSSSSLSSAFSLLSSSSSAHSPNSQQQSNSFETGVLKNHQNSDLEIEVASTLVGMKFSKTEF